jgi:exodeoxyribonuclease VII large subunit
MTDLFIPDSKSNVAEYTVSEISGALRRTVEDAFGHVRVRGEISGYRGTHSSGHAYFALKDDKARIEAVIWRLSFQRLRFKPEEGMEVVATGRLTTYPGKSTYQLVIDTLEPAGAGALMALMEERKRRLSAEGLFEAGRKRRLPFMPRVIGVITSPTGAVIRDIIHRIADRFPLHVVVWPVRVQGETTGAEVTAAISGFNALPPGGVVARPDVLIVARGGGSLEDLWGFNDEALVRVVAASKIPVISAVGHETDWTLVDFAADVRAPTPTGAAEMAVPVKAELEADLARLSARLRGCMSRSADRKRHALRAATRALPLPDQLLALPRRRFDEGGARLTRCLITSTERKRARLNGAKLSVGMLERRLSEARRRSLRSGDRLPLVFSGLVGNRRTRLARDAVRVAPVTLRRRIDAGRSKIIALQRQADNCAEVGLERRRARFHRTELRLRLDPIVERLRGRRQRLEQAARLLDSVSYQAILKRGFALVSDASGVLVRRAAVISSGGRLSIEFADGEVSAIATSGAAARRRRKTSAKSEDGSQGSLF